VADQSSLLAGGTAAVLFGVYADLAFNAYGATNSSPQTTELFAEDREDTLMKYVKYGHATALAYGAFGSVASRSAWPLVGTAVVCVTMHCLYTGAVKAGKGQAPPASSEDTYSDEELVGGV
jgi:hypothetical protein